MASNGTKSTSVDIKVSSGYSPAVSFRDNSCTNFTGPYIPEIVYSSRPQGDATNGMDSSSAGGDIIAGGAGEQSTMTFSKAIAVTPKGGNEKTEGVNKESVDRDGRKKGAGDNGDDSSDEDLLKGMRDSILLLSNRTSANNLLDWSFIDDAVLQDAINNSTFDSAKKEKIKKKVSKLKSDALALGHQNSRVTMDPDGKLRLTSGNGKTIQSNAL